MARGVFYTDKRGVTWRSKKNGTILRWTNTRITTTTTTTTTTATTTATATDGGNARGDGVGIDVGRGEEVGTAGSLFS